MLIPGLDGLRAVAITAVVWHHCHPGYSWLPISHNGFLGVDVFFVLSGFLITTLLLSEQDSTGTISLKHFYIRRSLRIFPLYYAILAVLALYSALSPASTQGRAFLEELPWHVGYASNWVELQSMMAITWSLSTEEQFYLLWPPLLAWLGVRSLWLVAAFLVLNQAVNFGALDDVLAAVGIPYESLAILQITFTPILFGVVLAYAMRVASFQRLLARLPRWAPIATCVVALALANVPGDLRGWPRLSFHAGAALVIALVVVRPTSVVVRALEWRPVAYLGTLSYGVYLLHKIALFFVNRHLGSAGGNFPEAVFATCLLVAVGAAHLSFSFFESPILRKKALFR